MSNEFCLLDCEYEENNKDEEFTLFCHQEENDELLIYKYSKILQLQTEKLKYEHIEDNLINQYEDPKKECIEHNDSKQIENQKDQCIENNKEKDAYHPVNEFRKQDLIVQIENPRDQYIENNMIEEYNNLGDHQIDKCKFEKYENQEDQLIEKRILFEKSREENSENKEFIKLENPKYEYIHNKLLEKNKVKEQPQDICRLKEKHNDVNEENHLNNLTDEKIIESFIEKDRCYRKKIIFDQNENKKIGEKELSKDDLIEGKLLKINLNRRKLSLKYKIDNLPSLLDKNDIKLLKIFQPNFK